MDCGLSNLGHAPQQTNKCQYNSHLTIGSVHYNIKLCHTNENSNADGLSQQLFKESVWWIRPTVCLLSST